MILLNMDIIDDLKCCGNCKYSDLYIPRCHKEESPYFGSAKAKGYCKCWEQDSLKSKER